MKYTPFSELKIWQEYLIDFDGTKLRGYITDVRDISQPVIYIGNITRVDGSAFMSPDMFNSEKQIKQLVFFFAGKDWGHWSRMSVYQYSYGDDVYDPVKYHSYKYYADGNDSNIRFYLPENEEMITNYYHKAIARISNEKLVADVGSIISQYVFDVSS
jgi:hypothetical protein